jgi:serine phosphatase RsbU (regulator of sigma subunit)
MNFNFFKYLVVTFFLFENITLISQNVNIDSCLNVLKTSKEDTNKVKLLNKIAWNIAYTNLQKGVDYSIQSYDLAKKLNFEKFYPTICNTRGAIYADMAEVALALNLYLEGVKYAKKYKLYNSLAALYNSLGNLYGTTEEPRKALSYYLAAIDAIKKHDPKRSPVRIYTNLASVYTTLQMFDSAMYFVKFSINYNIKINDEFSLATNYIALSEVYSSKKDYKNSLSAALESIKYAKIIGDDYTVSHSYEQLGNAYLQNSMYNEAKDALTQAVFYTKRTGDMPALELATLHLSELYEKTGEYSLALNLYKEYRIYKDSALNMESIQQVKNAEAKFENDKKQKELEILSQKQKHIDAESQKKKMLLFVAVFGILILICVLVILYRNNILKQKTNTRLSTFNKEINLQKELVEEKNKEITDSINYAKRIQQSVLTSEAYFKKYTNDFFILFKPKDIISGDFYWALNHDQKFIVMTADSTNHGVPGAMMSMMGINFLNEIVNEKKITNTSEILNQLRRDIIKTLNPESGLYETKDGIDCCLCSFDFKNLKLTYSNANNVFYLIRNKEITVSKTNKMTLGVGENDHIPFDQFEMEIKKNDLIIAFTDGYSDQFGGDSGKKFKHKQLEELLIKNAHLQLQELKQLLENTIQNWRGNIEQVDDICVVGIRV